MVPAGEQNKTATIAALTALQQLVWWDAPARTKPWERSFHPPPTPPKPCGLVENDDDFTIPAKNRGNRSIERRTDFSGAAATNPALLVEPGRGEPWGGIAPQNSKLLEALKNQDIRNTAVAVCLYA